MKICKKCFREFTEDDYSYNSPPEILGELFLKSTGTIDPRDLCPECKKEFGMMNLLGFNR